MVIRYRITIKATVTNDIDPFGRDVVSLQVAAVIVCPKSTGPWMQRHADTVSCTARKDASASSTIIVLFNHGTVCLTIGISTGPHAEEDLPSEGIEYNGASTMVAP